MVGDEVPEESAGEAGAAFPEILAESLCSPEAVMARGVPAGDEDEAMVGSDPVLEARLAFAESGGVTVDEEPEPPCLEPDDGGESFAPPAEEVPPAGCIVSMFVSRPSFVFVFFLPPPTRDNHCFSMFPILE